MLYDLNPSTKILNIEKKTMYPSKHTPFNIRYDQNLTKYLKKNTMEQIGKT